MVYDDNKNVSFHSSIQGPRLVKLFVIMGMCLLTFSLIEIILTPTSAVYEVSIYSAFPLTFWVILILSMILGQAAIILCIIQKLDRASFIIGFIPILMTTTVLLCMPAARGYFIYGSEDPMAHIGYMRDLVNNFYISNNDFYPLEHIFGVALYLIPNLSFPEILGFVPAFFSIFFIVGMFLFARLLFEKRGAVALVMLLASPLLFGNLAMAFAPNWQAFMMLPMVFFTYFRSQNGINMFQYRLMFLILLIVVTFIHPLIGIAMIITLFIVAFNLFLIQNDKPLLARFPGTMRALNPALIAIIVFLSWNAYAILITGNIGKILTYISGGASTSEFGKYVSIISYANTSVIGIIDLMFNTYGQAIILGLMSIISYFYLMRISRYKAQERKVEFFTSFSIWGFLVFVVLTACLFVLPFSFQFSRTLDVALFFSLILVPPFIHKGMMISKRRRAGAILSFFCVCLVLITVFSTMNLYPSPLVKSLNMQVTETSYAGMTSFFEIRGVNYNITEFGPSQDRYFGAIYGMSVSRINVIYTGDDSLAPVDHFGYPGNNSLSDSYNYTFYFLTNDMGQQFYPSLYPEYADKWRFYQADFNRLTNFDPGVNHVYTNRDLEVFLVL